MRKKTFNYYFITDSYQLMIDGSKIYGGAHKYRSGANVFERLAIVFAGLVRAYDKDIVS